MQDDLKKERKLARIDQRRPKGLNIAKVIVILPHYYYYIQGLMQSLVAVKTLHKTEIQETV